MNLKDPAVLARLLRMEKELAEKKRQRQAMDKAYKIARFLKEKYGAEKVYLYGSLAWGNFQAHSDIDLFVCGLKADHYWKMQLQVEELAAPFAVSVVCDDEAYPSLKKKVLERGLLLA